MLFKLAAPDVLGLALLMQRAAAQTVAEQLQKGMYAQDTSGDVDGAITIYRAIVASAQGNRGEQATAQYRLSQALLKKGDLDGAAREFQRLAANYSEYRTLISTLSGRAQGKNSRFTRGTLVNGRYIHTAT